MLDPIHPAGPVADGHYRQIVQGAQGCAIVSCDLQGRVTTWNEGARQMLGWTQDEMLGRRLHEVFTPEDVAAGEVEAQMARAQAEGRVVDDRWHLRKDGTRIRAAGELMPLRDEAGASITGFVRILREHSEQQRHDAAQQDLNETLRASEARLQMALDVGGMGVWQWDPATQEVKWWPGMETIHGLAHDKQPRSLDDYVRLVHPEDQARVADGVRAAIANKVGHHMEYRIVWPDGSIHWLEVRSNVLMNLAGELRILTGVCLDITERKRVESNLKFLSDASAELASLGGYQSTLEKIARMALPHFADWCAVDLLGEGGVLERVAAAHVDPAKEELARDLHRRFPQGPGRQDRGGPWNVLRTGQVERAAEISDEALKRSIPDPAYREALRTLGLHSYLGVPLVTRGKLLGVISFASGESGRRYGQSDQALAEDLAARAAVAIDNAGLLQALQDSDRAKDVFLATLAHELRNPLAPVWNGLSIIRRMSDDPARVAQVADMMERQVSQLARLVDDLLDVSRITTGKIELKKERTNLAAILASAVETSRPHIEAARHQLRVCVPPGENTDLEADPVRLAQVFSNLLNNAAKYTRPGGRIDVGVQCEPQRLVVRVRDNGAGIAPEMLDKVFALFTQGAHPAQRSQGGLGIGLSLVDGLVKLHGGTVEALSAGPDQGCEFVIYLPRSLPIASAQAPAPQEPPLRASAPAPAATGQVHPVPAAEGGRDAAGQRRRILVVDDNKDAAATLAELLEMMDSEVAVAHDGHSAVAEVRRFAPHVVLLDIGLPDITGYDAARLIRALEGVPQPRLIALTGWGQDQDKRMAAEAGFDDHWTKPVDPKRLMGLV